MYEAGENGKANIAGKGNDLSQLCGRRGAVFVPESGSYQSEC